MSFFSHTFAALLMCMVFLTGTLSAQDTADPSLFSVAQAQFDFEAANTLLEQGQFKEALKSYGRIQDTGLYSGGLYLNMAIAAVELDSLGLAKFYLQKALQDETTRQAAETGLMYVETQFSRQSATLPPLPWEQFFDFLELRIGAFLLYWFSFILIVLTVLLLLMSWFMKEWRLASTRKITALGVSIGLVILALSLFIDDRATRYQDAIIVDTEATVYSEADPSSPAIATGYEGYMCRVDFSVESNSDWHYIRLGNGQMGWIARTALRIH